MNMNNIESYIVPQKGFYYQIERLTIEAGQLAQYFEIELNQNFKYLRYFTTDCGYVVSLKQNNNILLRPLPSLFRIGNKTRANDLKANARGEKIEVLIDRKFLPCYRSVAQTYTFIFILTNEEFEYENRKFDFWRGEKPVSRGGFKIERIELPNYVRRLKQVWIGAGLTFTDYCGELAYSFSYFRDAIISLKGRNKYYIKNLTREIDGGFMFKDAYEKDFNTGIDVNIENQMLEIYTQYPSDSAYTYTVIPFIIYEYE